MKQRTIKNIVKVCGIGLHTGNKVTMSLKPAFEDTGVTFIQHIDGNTYVFNEDNSQVIGDFLCTKLVLNSKESSISTIEHFYAALNAFKIDNLIVEIDSHEIPIFDGSSSPFIYLLQEAEIEEQDSFKQYHVAVKPFKYEFEDKYIQLNPQTSFLGLSVEGKIDFNHPFISKTNQVQRINLSEKSFIDELSRARTFGFVQDVEKLRANNLCLGASLFNAIVLDEFKVVNEEGLRYDDEFSRHKLLDSIGDFYAVRKNLIADIQTYKTGHYVNNQFMRNAIENQCFEKVVLRNQKDIQEFQQDKLKNWVFA